MIAICTGGTRINASAYFVEMNHESKRLQMQGVWCCNKGLEQEETTHPLQTKDAEDIRISACDMENTRLY